MVTTDERVLVLMPTARDGERTRAALQAGGVAVAVCTDTGDLCREIAAGAGAALLTEELLTGCGKALREVLRAQPPWSDFPLVVLAREGAADRGLEFREGLNAALVERPVKIRSLLSVVRAALRGRRHQYAVRDHLAERERAQSAQAYLVRLTDALRPLSEPAEVQAVASRILGEHFCASRVAYFEIAGAEYVVERDYTNGVPSLVGRYPIESFGGSLAATFAAGRTVVESDATAQSGRSESERAAFAAISVRAHVDVPLVKDGAFVAGVTVQLREARDWTAEEVALVEQTAERTWAAVERARAGRSLRASERRYRTLFNSIDEGFCVIELIFDGEVPTDYRFVEVNPAFEKHTGLRGAVGRTVSEMAPGHEAYWFEVYGGVARSGEPVRFSNEATALGRWFDVYAFPHGDKVAVLFTDITDRRRGELERERLVEQLRDSDRKKDDFIALLAHELRNPLAPVRNGLQIVQLSDDRTVRERAQGMMDRQLTHMIRLIDDLLDVSRITRNKMELRRARVALADVVASAVEAARPALDASGHELTVSLPAAPVVLDADLTRLAQVFSNLLTNSAKYTPKNGRVWLAAERAGGRVVVTVRDTGIGIPTGSLATVFDMFSQVDRSVEKSTGGLGIGLALVKGLVEMHGGTVSAASGGANAGTTITVALPEAGRVEASEPVAAEEPVRGPARRILVVDDNLDGAESMCAMLELLGHEVGTAHDGLAAVERAEAFRPDVILMDVGMPRLSGLDATRRIRERAWGRGITIVALTGWGQENDREKSKAAGCDAHLVKPVSLSDLRRALAEVAERGQAAGAR